MKPTLAALALALTMSGAAAAQPPPSPSATAGAPAARPADVRNPRALTAAIYDLISGPAGPRDWSRFRSLFLPGARMTVTGSKADGTVSLRVLTLDDYQARSGATLLTTGFVERGVREEVHEWAHTAVVRSLYESRHAAGDAQPFARGINTFVMASDGGRWWIASLSWEAETPSTPIPASELMAQPPQP